MKIEPFRVDVPDATLTDLRERLAAGAVPRAAPRRWLGLRHRADVPARAHLVLGLGDYDWRATEATLNELDHFTTEIDGANIHFIHARSPEPNALPLVLTHGWPGSIVEFLEVIGPLTDPVAHGGDAADAFHVVCPSLPGYAFSGPTRERGWHPGESPRRGPCSWPASSIRATSRRAATGARSSRRSSASRTPSTAQAIHLNMLPPFPSTDDHTPTEDECLAGMASYNEHDSGYYKEQSTKPQTIGYSLDDSPVGLAAWIVEKFRTWSDCDGDVERSFTKDQLLDNLMLYWVTATAHSAGRMYYEFGAGMRDGTLDLFGKITVPVGYARYPKEIMRTSRRWAEAQYDVNHFADMPKGGHFAAFEVPELFLEDIRAWGRKVR